MIVVGKGVKVMNIKINKTSMHPYESCCTGGEWTTTDVKINVDENLPLEIQQENVIHSVIEVYCRNWPHDKVEELTNYIMEGLRGL